MALPVTSAAVVVGLTPVTSQETSPLEALGEAELNCSFCSNETYASSALEKYRRTRQRFSSVNGRCRQCDEDATSAICSSDRSDEAAAHGGATQRSVPPTRLSVHCERRQEDARQICAVQLIAKRHLH
eukprot:5714649-Prymnesium_polylepis.1